MASETKLCMTPKETAAFLNIGVQNVYALIHSAKQSGFPVFKIGCKSYYVSTNKLIEWIETAAAQQYGLDIEY